ncbi:adenosylcobinamide-GDP ribazoletransferase [Mariniluteicoccus flavus]
MGTLTVIPSGRFDATPASARVAMTLAPFAVVPLGLLAGSLLWLGSLVHAPALLIGVVVVAGLAWATRAMHVDGFADVVDGLGAGWDPERARAVMLRGDVGPMGALWLVVVAVAQVIGWSRVAELEWGWALATLLVPLSRSALTIPCLQGIAAMPGSDLGHVVAQSVPRWAAALWWSIGLAGLGFVGSLVGLAWWHGALAAAVAYAGVALLVRKCRIVFGGVNGDVMGASIEVALTLLLVVLACR